ncbi:MAG: hypothetical protein K1X67_21585 [Fimbriimonadaceae bacterium]|nr:hypothetical protein [Fimbriimonadaceae bacterium]
MAAENLSENPGLFRTFTMRMALALALVSSLPALVALLTAPAGASYLGFQYNADDHFVYAAWMRQAMDGQFFFDNRFTTDHQPGLTVHLYFFVLGLLAKVLTIPGAMLLAKVSLTAGFVVLLGRFIEMLGVKLFTGKLALALVCVGGGIGFIAWRNYGVSLDGPVGSATLGGLPIDVWQPEAFVFPSMLTNGLFMVSLCLITITLTCVLKARDSWKPVLPGALVFGVLMNIHSYDVLLVGLVLVGFLATSLTQKQTTWAWIARVGVIVLATLPAALWFVHVLRNDPVFQARAATETFSPNFRQVVAGLLPAIVLSLVGLFQDVRGDRRRQIGLGGLMALLVLGWSLASARTDQYWLSPVTFGVALSLSLAVVALLSSKEAGWNLVIAWAVIGLVAPYIPGLFQRKLLMAIAVPWCLLAAVGAWKLMENRDRAKRNLVGAMVILVFAGSSLRWFSRELMLVRSNVSNTTMHPVYLSTDMRRILEILNQGPGRKVVLAMPGVAGRTEDPDIYLTPFIPDLNPIASGLAGTYTYAGHWSETPDYAKRRSELVSKMFLAQTASPASQMEILSSSGADYIIAPSLDAFPDAGLADLSGLGEVVYDGSQFDLIRVRR